ncbi:MAG: ethanolamine utilization phosphate acetyltransferase EutD [Eubacteriales bacterium]|nr:ethanolamine utilization phosphate acetyltransferase EutD [Eubacteriales bacterium]
MAEAMGQTEQIVQAVMGELKKRLFIEVEASGRHVHLCRKDVEALFGTGYQLTRVRELSQPGQFVCKERVTLTGPKGSISNVVVLGPERSQSQAEISKTDALALGIDPPVRLSGELKGSPGIKISAGGREITLEEGVIIAKRHLHITPQDAERFHVQDREPVKIKVFGSRPVIFEDTIARVSEEFQTYVHIDYDEANACGFQKGTLCRIVRG